MSILYLVPTPLGDPDDTTLRALRILREVSAIAAVNESAAQTLMDHYGIPTPMIAYDIALKALEAGDVALITYAGTPGMGDAAHEIVVEAIAQGVRVEPLPGASAPITALVLSSLPTDTFVYVGALPDDLSRYTHERATMIFAANDVTEPAMKLLNAFGDRKVCITRLTPHEWIYRGTLSDAANYDRTQPGDEGIMFVVQGAPAEIAEVWDETRVRMILREHLRQGQPLKLVAKEIAALSGWDRRTVYALGIEVKKIL